MTNQPHDAAGELLACPFCGGRPLAKCLLSGPYISCLQCGGETLCYPTEAQAVAAWNTRIASVPPHPEVAGLVKQLRSQADHYHRLSIHGAAKIYDDSATALSQLAAENAQMTINYNAAEEQRGDAESVARCLSAELDHANGELTDARARIRDLWQHLNMLVNLCDGMDLDQDRGRPTEEEYQDALESARALLAERDLG